MRAQQGRQRRQAAAAQAKAIDAAAIAVTTGLGLMGLIAGLAALLH